MAELDPVEGHELVAGLPLHISPVLTKEHVVMAPLLHPLHGTTGNKRTRLRHACTPCHKAHTSCDPDRPCGRCEKLNIADQCVDAESKKRGRKPGSTKAALEAKKAKSEILGHLNPVLAGATDPPLLVTDVLNEGYVSNPMGDEVFAALAHNIKPVEPVSFSSPYARSLNPAISPQHIQQIMEDMMRNSVIVTNEIHYNKELGLVIKIGVTNTSKTPLHGLRLSLFFVRSESKEVDRPHSLHLLSLDGKIFKELTTSYTDLIADPFALNPGELKIVTMAAQFVNFIRRDAHFVLKINTPTAKEIIKEERIPIMLLNQCEGYRSSSRVNQGSKGFPIGPYSLKADTLRKLFNLTPVEGISPGDQFFLDRLGDGRFLAFAEVRRIEDTVPVPSVELDLYQGAGEGSSDVIAELRLM